MSIEHDSLSILNACVVLKSATIETSLLTESGNSFTIVVGEAIHLEDTFSNIWGTHKVDLEELSLKMAFIRTVLDQGLEKEGCSFLDATILKEYLNYAINGSFWDVSTLAIGDHLGQANGSLRIYRDHVSEDLYEVRSIVDLLAVRDDLICLSSLNESLNDSLWGVSGIRTHVDGESELGVELLNHIS